MAASAKAAPDMTDTDLVVTRVYDAPRALVFQAWSDPEHLMHWWAPKGCTTPACTVDFRVGGRFHYCIRMADGTEVWGRGLYREIVAPGRIVFLDSFADSEGNPVPPTHYGMSADHPAEALVTVTLTEEDGRTTVTLRHALPAAFPERAGTEQGWNDMLGRLGEHLPEMAAPEVGEVRISRLLDAPRALVWTVWTDPKHFAQWWGPHHFTNPVCEFDLRPGGTLHVVMRGPDGNDYPMDGIFTEVVAPERLVFTNQPLGSNGKPALDGVTTVTLAEEGGKTRLTVHARATVLQPEGKFMLAGMEAGWAQTIEHLERHLAGQ